MRSVSLEPKEVDSLVQTQERNDDSSGKPLLCVSSIFLTNWRKMVQFTKACSLAGFMRSFCWDALH